ncbi:hypothetical protein [Planosporangium mesophilum]|uniref:Uncharacterized protein n=1 Tax=Planosporangium mesophilum TaxID=689768 RepID=A0A8J3TBJ2_9ACTN|nr:hypothetical protein [Planosporangium mesophilum]NJC83625.1 hypothetical protein [Planosporangium mesophilum]GII22137.1 hypothetical protein Pme01_17340 [Planosporangium mesophilum]
MNWLERDAASGWHRGTERGVVPLATKNPAIPPPDPDQPSGPGPTDPEGPTDPKPTDPTDPTGPDEPPALGVAA